MSAREPCGGARWLTKREAALIARVSTSTIERAIASGALRAGGSPGLVLIHSDDLDRWITSRQQRKGPAAA